MNGTCQILRKYSNPFEHVVIAGPYSKEDLPFVESYGRERISCLLKALEAHSLGRLSAPVVPIRGKIGSGKTMLLWATVQESHQSASRFLVPISPVETMNALASPEATAEIFWRATLEALRSEQVPRIAPARPIDLYSCSVCREILKKAREDDEEKDLRIRGAFFKKPFPAHFAEFIQRRFDGAKFCEAKLPRKTKAAMAEVLDGKIREWKISHMELRSWLLAESFGASDLERRRTEALGRDPFELLGRFADLASQLGAPLTLVFDQFESLQMLGGDLERNLRAFFVRLFELQTTMRQKTSWRMPLAVVSVTSEAANSLGAHILEWLSYLPHGEIWLDINEDQRRLRDFGVAREFVQVYLQKFWPKVQRQESSFSLPYPTFPFGDEDLRAMHGQMNDLGEPSPRAWLRMCYKAWDGLVFRESPMEFDARRKNWLASLGSPGEPEKGPEEGKKTSSGKETAKEEKTSSDEKHGSIDPGGLLQDKDFAAAIRSECRGFSREQEHARFWLSVLEAMGGMPCKFERPTLVANDRYVRFLCDGRICFLGVSTRNTRGGGLANEWGEYQKFLKGEKKSLVVFLRDLEQGFPNWLADHVDGAPIVKHHLTEKDRNLAFWTVLLRGGLRQERFQAFADGLPRERDFSGLIQKEVEAWDLYRKIAGRVTA
jgi:hypothetical protein